MTSAIKATHTIINIVVSLSGAPHNQHYTGRIHGSRSTGGLDHRNYSMGSRHCDWDSLSDRLPSCAVLFSLSASLTSGVKITGPRWHVVQKCTLTFMARSHGDVESISPPRLGRVQLALGLTGAVRATGKLRLALIVVGTAVKFANTERLRT